MSKIYRRKETVEVMYVTDDTFDAPHPNEDHMTGMTFNAQNRTVELSSPGEPGERIARVGDVIVRHGKDGENAWDSIWNVEDFEAGFEPVPSKPDYCFQCSEAAEHNSFCPRAGDASAYHYGAPTHEGGSE